MHRQTLLQALVASATFVAAQGNDGGCGGATITPYVVASGDTLSSIASQFNSGICNIAALNQIANPNVITVGENLEIPADCANPDNTSCINAAPPADNTCVNGPPASYTVVSGDTLSQIANNFLLTLDALEQANSQIQNFDLIYPGQVINIPVCPQSTCDMADYTIQSGDTFYDLAITYTTTVGQIEADNPGVDPNALQVGQVIHLPQNCRTISMPRRGPAAKPTPSVF